MQTQLEFVSNYLYGFTACHGDVVEISWRSHGDLMEISWRSHGDLVES